MNIQKDAEAFLEKAAEYGSVLGLSSITELMRRLKNPQDDLRIIHIAGTNGKGSTTAFLQSILMQEGYRVGVYTSPAVFAYEERFVISGEAIPKDRLWELLLEIRDICDGMVEDGLLHPTLFEIETALAFLYLKEEECDFAIIEVGMGGDTDATNVMSSSFCSVFASIGRDHMHFLGDTIAEIAHVKGGIMKPGSDAISIWQEDEVVVALKDVAREKDTNLTFANRDELMILQHAPLIYNYKEYKNVKVAMLGAYQLDNSVLALEVIRVLRKKGVAISEESIYQGMEKAYWPGRMEQIKRNPQVFIDGAHNVPAALRLKETIENSFTNKTITYIIGVLADKEHKEMLEILLPFSQDIVLVTPHNPRALLAKDLCKEINALNREAVVADSMEEAVQVAYLKKNDCIIAFGSLSYLQEFKACVLDAKE